MKKTLLLAVFAFVTSHVLACICQGPIHPDYYVDYANWGKLQLIGNQLSRKDGSPAQLRGMSIFLLQTDSSNNCVGESQWKKMKQYGANTVRLAMHIEEENAYLSNPAKYKTLVKQSIAETASLNMYCIVDWHILGSDPNNHIEESRNFFGEISKYCAENGYDHVLYEICNEPECEYGWSSIKNYAEYVIPSIIENQPDAMIIVGTNNWSQKILEPISNPISTKYKFNVLYSFHYYSCSHYHLLGDFRSAQGSIPVFVSEWSAVKFDGNGPFCTQNADDFIYSCGTGHTKQLVSWCFANWRSDDESSFLTGTCDESSLSQLESFDDNITLSKYIVSLMYYVPSEDEDYCCDPRFGPCSWYDNNKIPTTTDVWQWDAYNGGGEGIAYHDGNAGAWEKDEDGIVLGYKVGKNEEVDVFSLAFKMQWLNDKFPYSTVEDDKVVDWDPMINTDWTDANNDKKPTYRSLNGGRMYSGAAGSRRPDEGVDLYVANCLGTELEDSICNSLGLVEEDEWIKYTVDVEASGYYKLKGIISSEYKVASKNGEIQIVSHHGNHLRSTSVLSDDKAITSFGFPKTTVCADDSIDVSDIRNCWAEADAISGDYKDVLVAFPEVGLNQIKFIFTGDASGVGPLIFEYYQPLEENDPITSVAETQSEETEFVISPNPTSGEFTITLDENSKSTVEIVNMAGQVVVAQKIEGSVAINRVLPSGVYTVVVESNGAVSTQKLVVK